MGLIFAGQPFLFGSARLHFTGVHSLASGECELRRPPADYYPKQGQRPYERTLARGQRGLLEPQAVTLRPNNPSGATCNYFAKTGRPAGAYTKVWLIHFNQVTSLGL